ncbi:hypothetical protein RhiirA4_462134 [Rhizophagus irregularis]|uniref:Uncharacterized protein n=1 Tax=Rhizophagus irregularis TaxID=588596 RepID=A0A2I1GKB9_9GLOM|nr:hypothetical protein RhiirA4_462134 [Rhizophagus irregularis]
MINRKKRLSINVTHLEVDKPKQMTGANMLYSTHKSTSYALLDFNSLRKDNTQLQVFTNNKRVIERYKSPYEISSDRKNVNVKFRISKYLTAVMLALPLSKGTRTKYFNRIRFLLLEKYQLICNRICSQLYAIVLSRDRRICGKHKKKIYSAQSGISYMKQLAFEGRKSYERPSLKCKKPVKY